MKTHEVLEHIQKELARKMPKFDVVLGAREPYTATRYPALMVFPAAGEQDEKAPFSTELTVIFLLCVKDTKPPGLSKKMHEGCDALRAALETMERKNYGLAVGTWMYFDGGHSASNVAVVEIACKIIIYKEC